MMTSLVVLCSLLGTHAEGHEALNPLYADLRMSGVDVGAKETVKLPSPVCADGLNESQHQALLKEIVGKEFRLDQFTRNSQVAPNRLRLKEITPVGPDSLTRSIEILFIAYGNLDTLANKEFLDRVANSSREDGKATPISADALKKRGLTIKDTEHEGFAHLVFTLIDKVEMNLSGHSFWSKTSDSILVAGRLDRRFKDDAEFPNVWKPITKGRDGKKTVGKASPYDGAGYYVKITRLNSPKGALLVEGHVIFAEPKGWFEGTNLLRAKLPAVMTSQARSFRRELTAAAK
jgi:hypothetical protein